MCTWVLCSGKRNRRRKEKGDADEGNSENDRWPETRASYCPAGLGSSDASRMV
jgi:hypothetical protein